MRELFSKDKRTGRPVMNNGSVWHLSINSINPECGSRGRIIGGTNEVVKDAVNVRTLMFSKTAQPVAVDFSPGQKRLKDPEPSVERMKSLATMCMSAF
jgi:hypothetical protein